MSFTRFAKLDLSVWRAKRLLPLMMRLSLIVPFSFRVNVLLDLVSSSLLPTEYLFILVITFGASSLVTSSGAKVSLKNISFFFSSSLLCPPSKIHSLKGNVSTTLSICLMCLFEIVSPTLLEYFV